MINVPFPTCDNEHSSSSYSIYLWYLFWSCCHTSSVKAAHLWLKLTDYKMSQLCSEWKLYSHFPAVSHINPTELCGLQKCLSRLFLHETQQHTDTVVSDHTVHESLPCYHHECESCTHTCTSWKGLESRTWLWMVLHSIFTWALN